MEVMIAVPSGLIYFALIFHTQHSPFDCTCDCEFAFFLKYGARFKRFRFLSSIQGRVRGAIEGSLKPMPPFMRVKMGIAQRKKDTQPSQTCSGGFVKTQLYAICRCFFAIGECNLI
jgi:hypothetical protein